MVQSSNLTISFSSESSIEDELKRESNADVITISVSVFRDILQLAEICNADYKHIQE